MSLQSITLFEHVDDVASHSSKPHGCTFDSVIIKVLVEGIEGLSFVLLDHPPELLYMPVPRLDILCPACGIGIVKNVVAFLACFLRGKSRVSSPWLEG